MIVRILTFMSRINTTSDNFKAITTFIFQHFSCWFKKYLFYNFNIHFNSIVYEQRHEISNNVVCATSKASDQPAHMRSLIRAFDSRLNVL